jgi:hypothetical protein
MVLSFGQRDDLELRYIYKLTASCYFPYELPEFF